MWGGVQQRARWRPRMGLSRGARSPLSWSWEGSCEAILPSCASYRITGPLGSLLSSIEIEPSNVRRPSWECRWMVRDNAGIDACVRVMDRNDLLAELEVVIVANELGRAR